MRLKFNQFLTILIISAFILAQNVASFASDLTEEEVSLTDFEGENVPEVQEDENTGENIVPLSRQDEFLARLKEELNLSKTDYRQIMTGVEDMKLRLKTVSNEKNNLQMQIQNIDDLITLTTDKLISVIKQVVVTENEIALLYEEIEIKETALNAQKQLLKDYINLIYVEENAYFSTDPNGNVSTFKMLLADGSVGTNLKELQYFSLLNSAGQQMVERLYELSDQLKGSQKKLDEKKAKLLDLQKQLQDEKQQLEFQKTSKTNLLNITLGQEDIYRQLLEQTLKEQEQLLNDIRNLSEAVEFIAKKIAEEGENFNPDDYMALLDYRTSAVINFKLTHPYYDEDGFAWPIDPDRGISAYFRDPNYVGVFGVQHNATDMPTPQGTPIRAAADGVVYTARDNGYGYSYISIAHSGGMITVYGHVYEILVKEGDMVSQGAIIGLSGGMPGTKGAGYMTTGPHLHFEMLLNGLYVDPLNYLPLNVLKEEQTENLPEKYVDAWKEAVKQAEETPVSR